MSIAEEAPTVDEPQPDYVTDGLVAEYETPEQMLAAAETLRDAGYKRFEAHSPFPVHGSDEAVGVRPTILPWFVLGAAATGFTIALSMIWFMNYKDYPFQISAKPLFALPPAMPIAFELTVLLAASTAFFCVFLLSNLPLFSNPLLRSRHFARATDDRFVISVDASDRLYGTETADLLRQHEPLAIEEMKTEKKSEALLPMPMVIVGVIGAILSLVPFGVALNMRTTTSEQPRIHLVQDMDQQPRFNAQQSSSVFDDGRAARPEVLGAIARTGDESDTAYQRGVIPGSGEGIDNPDADPGEQTEDAGAEAAAAAAGSDGGAEGDGEAETEEAPEPDWVEEFPEQFEVSAAKMERGQERYNIYCSPCHGLGGHGNGLVTQRAELLQQGTWQRPVSFHSEGVRSQPVGRLYNTVSNGIRKMPGYSAQIPVDDRWAIVLYLRALQRSQLGDASELDPQTVKTLRMNK